MQKEQCPFEQHIFVCTNSSDKCGKKGRDIFKKLRKEAKDRGLHPRIRVAQSGCLGKCSKGVNIMVYPDNVWYHDVKKKDIPDLLELYLKA